MEINKSHQVKSVAFQGHQHKKTETGAQAYEFNCMYDSSKYDCEVQFFRVGIDDKKNFFIEKGADGRMEPFYKADVVKGGVVVDPAYDLDLEEDQPFGYRMVLKDKNTGKVVAYPKEDNNEPDGCTIVTRKGTSVTIQGPMYLGIPDSFAPGYVHHGFTEPNTGEIHEPDFVEKQEIADKLRSANRTFSNRMGGKMAGLEAKLPELRAAGCKRLITTPMWGGDNASSHMYWPENNMLTCGKLGNINNYKSLQRKAGSLGMNIIDDGTFSSEGLQGIHFQRAIKWMDNEEKPPEYYFFRMSGIQDGALNLGVVPENYQNLSSKIVNCPFEIIDNGDGTYNTDKKNKSYNPDKPTYFQIFDNSLVSEHQKFDKNNLIEGYAKLNQDGNKLGINNHNDTEIPYYFEVNPTEIKRNIRSFNEVNKLRPKQSKIDSPEGTRFIGALSGIEIGKKTEGGFVCWNAYTDMVKYNYFTSNYDIELLASEKNPVKRAQEMDRMRRGNCQVRDMATQVAKYRTALVRDTLTEYFAKTIGELSDNPNKAYERITSILNSQNPENPKLPDDIRVSKEVVQNVYDDNYEMPRSHYENYDEAITASLMSLPLDSIEFAPDAQGALSSPYLSKLSPDGDHVGQSRYDAMNDSTYQVPEEYAKTYNKMNDIFTKDIKQFADKVLKQVDINSKEKLFDKDGNMTEYGKYLIPLVGQDIARFAVTMGLMPKAGHKHIAGGEIAYDYDQMTKDGTLSYMGVNGDSQADEANQIVNKLKKGVNKLSSNDAEIDFMAKSIYTRFARTNANTLKMAEVMLDKSGLGLDWRFDAAKDVADFDSVNNGNQRFDTAWNNDIIFWGDMDKAIKSENRNSYTVAEITDVNKILGKTRPKDASDVIYDSEGKAIGSLLDLAGITSEANYSYFFDGITYMFSRDFINGDDKVGDNDESRVKQLESSLERFAEKPIDYKRNSYTFASNHDKPRLVHCLSLDMSLFHTDLNNKANHDHRVTAYKIMNDIMKDEDISPAGWDKINESDDYFNNVSPKAIANGELIRGSIGIVNEKMLNEEKAAISYRTDISEEEKQAKYRESEAKYNRIYTALSQSLAEVVNGHYYKNEPEMLNKPFERQEDINFRVNHKLPDSLKKTNEKEGFGTKPIPDAFDILYDQASAVHGIKGLLDEKTLLEYRNRVDAKATEVGRTKTRIIMRYLGALPGNPTLLEGDEFGQTGYEEKCENTHLQNRPPLNHAEVEVIKDENGKNINPNYRKDIAEYRDSILDIFRARKDDDMNRMEALNNGTLYKLDKQVATNGKGCSAIISHATNGAMNISVFNPNGITTNPKEKVENLVPNKLTLQSIYLKGPKGKISLDVGTEFRNINPEDKNVYKVYNDGDEYFIRCDDGGKFGKDIVLDQTTAPDGVMALYHIPDDIVKQREALVQDKEKAIADAKAGGKYREYYNPTYNIRPADAYDGARKPKATRGENFDVTSKD
ncbi:MAG: hypothetical protein K6E29_04805 [Cyanobacteria bacterium RUI128]|nr:hypothetical protein [Cyanobacteria bacterium RUI128]